MPARRSRKPTPSRGGARRAKARSATKGAPSASHVAQARIRTGSRSRRAGPGRKGEFARLLLEERKRLAEELSEIERHQVKTEEKPVADGAGGGGGPGGFAPPNLRPGEGSPHRRKRPGGGQEG